MTDGPEEQKLRYEQAMLVASHFWEWRNKLMRFVFTGIGGALAATAWMFDRNFGRWICVPLLFGGLLSVASAFFDRRSGWIVGSTYRVGREIEVNWKPLTGTGPLTSDDAVQRGIFSALALSQEGIQRQGRGLRATVVFLRKTIAGMWAGRIRTFGTLLPLLFAFSGAVLLVLALVALILGPHKS
ncbi:MAG: hypothetical protein ACREF0_02600 [Acetobacteraceae bacterium]